MEMLDVYSYPVFFGRVYLDYSSQHLELLDELTFQTRNVP